MSIKRRLERLEADSDLASGCPECGIGPDSPIEYVVEWESDESKASGPERCPRCGVWLIIGWPDLPAKLPLPPQEEGGG